MDARETEWTEVQRQRRETGVANHLAALSNGITLHKRRLAEIEKREQRAAAEVSRLQKALDAERARVADLEAKIKLTGAEADTDIRNVARDVDGVRDHVMALDRMAAVEIRKSTAPRSTVKTSTPVRDPKTQRITEVIVLDEARPGVAVIQVPIRDASMRIVRTESYEVPVEEEDA